MRARVGDAAYPHGKKTVAALDAARDLVAHPTILPCVGADQHARHRGLINPRPDCPLDVLLAARPGFIRDPAVHEARHAIWTALPPALVNHLDPRPVFIMGEGKKDPPVPRIIP